MKSALILCATLLAGCTTNPEYYCKAGYAFAYSYATGYKQIWNAEGHGVPCEIRGAQ